MIFTESFYRFSNFYVYGYKMLQVVMLGWSKNKNVSIASHVVNVDVIIRKNIALILFRFFRNSVYKPYGFRCQRNQLSNGMVSDYMVQNPKNVFILFNLIS